MKAYQLKSSDIDLIIDRCGILNADEKLEVFGFGQEADLTLHIQKDVDYCRETDEFNLVTCSTYRNGKAVDDTGDVHVTDGSLYRELERIYLNDFRKSFV
ncbi:Uncharacterised protein [Anaerostipes hadrus]|uniref:Uncharacterized protein n=1 Tax=Anaerostipes hadrus TaxID=649756 RepID=A0A174JJH6_ANAHA|nr:hypothetical protein [Anaerostipes hadrus]CUO98007.1 Uncharacterised protein [Anaerostipes hadrus]